MTTGKPVKNASAFVAVLAAACLGAFAPGASAAERLWNSEIQRDLLPDKPKSDVSAPKRTEQQPAAPERKMRFDFDLPAERPMLLLPTAPAKGDKEERKDEEKRDQKRNWIFVDPEKAAQAASGAEEEEREPTPEEALLPYKGVMQQYLEAGTAAAESPRDEGSERREASAREPQSLDLSVDRDLDVSADEPGARTGGAPDAASALRSAFFGGNSAPKLPPPPSASLGSPAAPAPSAFGSANSGGSSAADERQLRDQQFQQLLRGSAFSPQSSGAAPGFGSTPASSSVRDYSFGSPRSPAVQPGGFNSSPTGSGAFMVPGATRGIAPSFGSPALSPTRPASPGFSTIPSYTPTPAPDRSPPTMAPAILPGPGGQRRF